MINDEMRFNSLAFRISGPAILVGLLVISFLGGCRHSFDPLLAKADSMMEEHPDSSLMILADYHLSPGTSAADSAYYALLLTHARYKNFIDETDDSLISLATKYFLARGDEEKASRALFLQGMIQLNAQRLGEAAVSFSKGLDIAREGKCYIWEGQCARGLCMVYGKLHDGSAQVDYAERSLEAFKRTGDNDWIDYSRLTLAAAFNNNGKYEESLSELNKLCEEGAFLKDSYLLAELYRLKGLSLSALGMYAESLDSYSSACNINKTVLTDWDKGNIQTALFELLKEDACESSYPALEDICKNDSYLDAFTVYAREGRYKEAYESLESYKNVQDSVLSVIFSNNVSELVNQYKSLRTTLMSEKIHKERISILLIILILIVVGIAIVWRVRERMLKEMAARLRAEADMESLRSDLLSQLDVAKTVMDYASKPAELQKTVDFESIIRQRYAEANRLCDDYYQKMWCLKDKEEDLHEEIRNIVRNFTEKDSLDKIAEYVDEKSGGVYSSFKKDFYFLPSDSHRLFLYIMLNFSARTISVILGQSINSVYTKKSRLKTKIEQCGISRKSEYLSFF